MFACRRLVSTIRPYPSSFSSIAFRTQSSSASFFSSFDEVKRSVANGVSDSGTYLKDTVVEGGSYLGNSVVEGGTQLVNGTQYLAEQSTEVMIDNTIETLKMLQQKLVDAEMADAVETKLSVTVGVASVSFRLLKDTEKA